MNELEDLLPDDFYWLTIVSPEDGAPVGNAIIYCHGMASSSPKAFLPLPAERASNYASTSKEQSSLIWKCTNDSIYNKHGYTEFDMVRINLNTSSRASTNVHEWSYCLVWIECFEVLSLMSGVMHKQL